MILTWVGVPGASIAAAVVSAGMAVGLALQVILDYFLTRPEIWTEKPPAVAVTGLNDSSVDLKAMAWVHNMDYGSQCGLKASMTEGIKKELDRNGISIPFPQMDLHIKKD